MQNLKVIKKIEQNALIIMKKVRKEYNISYQYKN